MGEGKGGGSFKEMCGFGGAPPHPPPVNDVGPGPRHDSGLTWNCGYFSFTQIYPWGVS